MPSYKNPTITETLVELHFRPGLIDTGLMLKLLPALQKIGLDKPELTQDSGVQINANDRSFRNFSVPRIKVWSEDKTKLVQFKENEIVVNLVGKYPGWSPFKDLFTKVIGAVKADLGVRFAVSSVGLQTIDKIDVSTAGDFSIGRYLNCDGYLIPTWYKDSKVPCDIILGRGLPQSGENRQVKIVVKIEASKAVFTMHSIFHNAVSPSSSPEQLLETLHDESTSTFERLITDTTRTAVMGGTK